jgi:hypothetical protein
MTVRTLSNTFAAILVVIATVNLIFDGNLTVALIAAILAVAFALFGIVADETMDV